MGMDTVQLETAVNTISQEYLLEFTSEYGIPEALHPELPGPDDRIVDFPEGKVGVYTKFFEFAYFRLPLSQFLFDILGYYQIHLSQLSVIGAAKQEAEEEYPPSAIPIIWTLSKTGTTAFSGIRKNTGYTPYSHPKTARGATLLSGNKPQILPGGRGMEDPAAATDSSGVPSTIERSPLDFADEAGAADQVTMAPEVPPPEDVPTTSGAPEAGQAEGVAAIDPSAVTESRKRGHDGSFAAIELGMASTRPVPVPESAPADVSDPDPLSFADPRSRHPVDVAQSSQGTAVARDPESENASFASVVGSPESIYRPEWGVTNGSMLDTPEACHCSVSQADVEDFSRGVVFFVYFGLGIWCRMIPRLVIILEGEMCTSDLVDHVAPSGYFAELRHLHSDDFLRQYNVNLARQVAMGSQLRLRFEQEAKLLKKSIAQVARRDKRIQAREHEIKNLEALLEAEADMKKATEEENAKLSQELENMRALILDLQVSNNHLTQQVATLQEQVSGEEKLKAAFEEFKQYEDNRVEQRCAEMDARLDALSIDFDEELYPHMLTAIAGHRWMIGRGLRLAVMKYGESLELRQAFADVVSAGIAKGMSEGLRHEALKDLKYPLVDQLEGLKDTPMDVIMVALYLESNTGDDVPQQVRDLRPSSSQLTIPKYPEVRDPMNPWAYKEEMLLADAIAANVSRAKKKKKYRIVCRIHGVGSAHHARSDGVPVSVPTIVPQGLAIFLADAA
uniref:Transposase (Putative), gypsy type n=1 Tax=Tanacetum cinerariifolium TaxID=118510 RepID=A0A6L2NWC9_TANCI|nr:transposase (putative), gypsy type [Tanacetum cinerariifolium]